MTNKTTKSALLTSSISLLLCFAMLLGTTFAWFTDSVTSMNNVIQSGNLDAELWYWDNGMEAGTSVNIESEPELKLFRNVDGEEILWEPGVTGFGQFEVKNEGTLALKYQLMLKFANATETPEGKTLADVLSVYAVARNGKTGDDSVMEDENLEALRAGGIDAYVPGFEAQSLKDFVLEGYLLPGESFTYELGVFWEPTDNDNDYNVKDGLSIDFGVTLVATQMTYEKDSYDDQYDKEATYPEIEAKAWDGTANTSWYNDTETEFAITTAEQLAGLAELVDAGNTFEGKTIKLGSDINLDCKDANGESICFDPIGSYRNDVAFKGTFDGQGYTIKNMTQNTWALDNGYHYGDLGLGLFGLVEDATIKNLKMDGADLSGESAIVGIVAATAYGDCTFENITVSNSKGADYQYYAGGIVGWASGDHKYINCNVDASTTIAAQWGDFDNSTGGVIGGAGGNATIKMEDCNVACRIDAYNDVTSSYQWYAYRRCGMLIGNTGKTTTVGGTTYAAAPQLTCENVTVTYGDWANYTYCEFAGTSWPYVRVQAGVSNSAYSNPRYGHPTDANGNEVVDDNHVHNAGEDHQILCVFDQLYGGGQGVYGTTAHDGVTVVYNNK